MASPIESYALVGDTHTAALVADDGSVDWWCVPRFDSAACFAALLGEPGNGRWQLAPMTGGRASRRRYRGRTLVLETEWDTPDGTVRVVDFMPPRKKRVELVRIVEGVSGAVRMGMELLVRFDYGAVVPWVRQVGGRTIAVAGPDALVLQAPVPTHGRELSTTADFTVRKGQTVPFVLTWHESHLDPPRPADAKQRLRRTVEWWETWASSFTYRGEWEELVARSAITLKALTYAPTGGIVAAPTTSLPEWIGSVRNWDYRFVWLRDATFTLLALRNAGFTDEAMAWRDWLLRAVAGDPSKLQIMYGAAGERRLGEYEVPWLAGYEHSSPVRVGNAASEQYQLDVYGEVVDALYQTRPVGAPADPNVLALGLAILHFLDDGWRRPDDGIWEVRGNRRHFTHSKVMAWGAFDRAVRLARDAGLGDEMHAKRWAATRDAIHREVCEEGFDADRNAFVQSYGSKALDAATLMIPLVGFLPADDPRMVGTVAAIERELVVDGFVQRYETSTTGDVDGLPRGEGTFLPCSFWLADNLALQGRVDDARALFARLCALCNDVGLISEEYDPASKRLLGNFPQAFTHISLVNTACNLTPGAHGPAVERSPHDRRGPHHKATKPKGRPKKHHADQDPTR